MDKQIISTFGLFYKTEPFIFIKPLYCTLSHVLTFLCCFINRFEMPELMTVSQ